MSSGAISTPFSISTKDETHARFQRLVPPRNGRFNLHDPRQPQALGIELLKLRFFATCVGGGVPSFLRNWAKWW